MKKLTFLWLAVGCLFLLNIGTLVILYTDKNKGGPHFHPKKFDETLINTLQLDERQISEFNRLKREHHEMIVALDEEMRAPVASYFNQLLLQNDSSNIHVLEKKISDIYVAKLQVTYRHFSDIKALCTVQQQKNFEHLIPEMMQVMHPKPHFKK